LLSWAEKYKILLKSPVISFDFKEVLSYPSSRGSKDITKGYRENKSAVI